MDNVKKAIEIRKQTFDTLILDYISKIRERHSEFSQKDYITLVRIWNTISINNLQAEKGHYLEFYNLFYTDLFKLACTELQATLTKGLAFYSAEHDLWFGGTLNENSYFSLAT
jgi:hypothetical protein